MDLHSILLVSALALYGPTLAQATIPSAGPPGIAKASVPGLFVKKTGAENAAGDNHGRRGNGGTGLGSHDDGANHH